jgi:hypothetical protein
MDALSGIRTHDLSVRAGVDGSCFRPRGHCDRQRTDSAYVKFVRYITGMTQKFRIVIIFV